MHILHWFWLMRRNKHNREKNLISFHWIWIISIILNRKVERKFYTCTIYNKILIFCSWDRIWCFWTEMSMYILYLTLTYEEDLVLCSIKFLQGIIACTYALDISCNALSTTLKLSCPLNKLSLFSRITLYAQYTRIK